MDFIYDPYLVLYLPLYKLDGVSFMSKDAYGHLCTVTGALWTPYGRNFDGTDDKITVPDHPVLDVSTAMTALVWSNATKPDSNYETLFAHFDTGANQRAWSLGGGSAAERGYLVILASDDGTYNAGHQYEIRSKTDQIDGSWHLFGLTWNAGSGVIYIDGTTISQSEDHKEISTLHPSTADLTVGATLNSGATQRCIPGHIGEVWLYNRVLTPQEIQDIYLATKWRYR